MKYLDEYRSEPLAKKMVEETYEWDKVSETMKTQVFEPLFTRG